MPWRGETGFGRSSKHLELKQANSDTKRLNDELEQRVAGRNRELTEANLQLRRALEEIDKLRQSLESENAYLREEVREASGSTEILGNSHSIRRVLEQVEMVAPTDATVLVSGETGVGKELIARAIHERSPRRGHPLIKVNCTAIPRELFESEFFGHVRGAFTGAMRDRIGRFQLADGGTLFLDEVGDLPPEMQPKLLRVLQEGEFERVGDEQTRRANVRIIAASNRDLRKAVREGRFREDLYYRLSVFPIEVPPLRERKEDIPVLAKYFFESACRRFKRTGLVLSEGQLQQLLDYDWPGNIRELQNVIDRAVIGARDGSFRFDLPDSTAPRNGQGHARNRLKSKVRGDFGRGNEAPRTRQYRRRAAAQRRQNPWTGRGRPAARNEAHHSECARKKARPQTLRIRI